ncbi:hypothetical protein [Pelagibacterium limicola]|uniref:hypothetical protein n=1 Tax=Pelagibacterium limicola TaxID=2791022 RepID=UPI0018AF75C7|nr:hypothetical protein [Pelagibacterium limicola]
MSVAALAKLKRAIDELQLALTGAARLPPTERLALKSELENMIQRIDELRQRL